MAPPPLTRDVPVADVLEPVDVDRLPALGQNANPAIADAFKRRLGERPHLHEPLIRQPRLDDRVAPIAMSHGMLVWLDARQLLRLLERANDSLTRLEPVDAEQ